jgi:hypothetical protein
MCWTSKLGVISMFPGLEERGFFGAEPEEKHYENAGTTWGKNVQSNFTADAFTDYKQALEGLNSAKPSATIASYIIDKLNYSDVIS